MKKLWSAVLALTLGACGSTTEPSKPVNTLHIESDASWYTELTAKDSNSVPVKTVIKGTNNKTVTLPFDHGCWIVLMTSEQGNLKVWIEGDQQTDTQETTKQYYFLTGCIGR